MSYQQPIPNPNHTSLYPQVIDSNPEAPINYKSQSPPSSSQSPPSNLYPSLDMRDLTENLFPETAATGNTEPSAPPQADEETLIKVPGAILHLIDQSYSVELACSDFKIIRLIQDGNVVAVLASVGDEIQWPLTKDIAAVKLDDSHYFFSLSFPPQPGSNSDSDLLNYGLTIASKGQEKLLQELDGILQQYSCFSVQKVSEKVKEFDGEIAKEVTPLEMTGKKREVMEEKSAAYWTTLAPNVEDYSGTAAKLIAAGSGQLIRGILWCGEVTVDRLKWGNKVLKKRMIPGETSEVSPQTLKRIKR